MRHFGWKSFFLKLLLTACISGAHAQPVMQDAAASDVTVPAVAFAAAPVNGLNPGTAAPSAPPIVQVVAQAAESVPPAGDASPPSAPIPLVEPSLVDASQISAGDTAWMLTATALVLLMTIPGLALFYAGMVRKKNMMGTTCTVS